MGKGLRWGARFAFAGAAVWTLSRFWRVITIGGGYKAKILASIIFHTGRSIDVRRTEEVGADAYWPMRLLHVRVEREERLVTVSFLGLGARTAISRPGLGATLLPAGGKASPASAVPQSPGAQDSWPEGRGSAELLKVLASAFAEPNPKRLRRTRAIVVVRDGRIVAERYAPGFTMGTRFPGWSMTKGVLGALVGILVGQERLSLGGQSLLPEWREPDPRATIRLEDLLRMRSGLEFSELYSDLSSHVVEMLFNRGDTAAYAASQPLTSRPGAVWSYSSGTTNILSRVVRHAVGEADYPDWPRRMLFDPIGMSSAILEPDASGTFVGSSFMLATARDWARFGQLYLQDGLWEGRRVLPEGWVGFSTSPTPQSPAGIYGAHWWLGLNPELGGGTAAAARIAPDAFFAVGHEGQTLTVIPSLRLVVVRLGLSIHIDAWNHARFLVDLQDAL